MSDTSQPLTGHPVLDCAQGARASARVYRRARRLYAEQPGRRLRNDYTGEQMSEEEFRRYWQTMILKRIAAYDPRRPNPRWRKMDPDYQRGLLQDQQDVHRALRQNVRLYHIRTFDLLRRYQHLCWRRGDDD